MHKQQPRPGILDIVPYVPGNVDNTDYGKANLASNESPLGASPAAQQAFRDIAAKLHQYPDGAATRLRQSIAEAYGLDPKRLICANGSERLIDLLIRAYAGPGDEVLYTEHGFLMYPICARAAGATPVTAPERDYTTDVDALLAAVTPRTRLVFVANPNNPTGTYISASEVRRLRRGLPGNVILVIDSAYAEYVEQKDYSAGHELVDNDSANVVVLHTFSKIYGLAALRLGWAHCPDEIADVLNRIRGSFNVSACSQAAGIAALADTAHTAAARAHNSQWRPWLERELAALGLAVIPSAGNFVLVRFKNKEQSQAAHRHMLERNVVLRPMGAYHLSEALRITVGKEHENKACIAGLKEFLRGA
ncbi:MAG TPA: histidinol-phosphate transaminase [Gammaproteobacteria bacterium]|nr:histidinol-phosphate transaminase [Gammaproteobacteria bacterium]